MCGWAGMSREICSTGSTPPPKLLIGVLRALSRDALEGRHNLPTLKATQPMTKLTLSHNCPNGHL